MPQILVNLPDRNIRETELAARVSELRAQAAAKMALSDKARGAVTDDYAFWTQPAYGNAAGRAFARQRDRERARIVKAGELAGEARRLNDKADTMEKRGVVVAGDALAAHNAKVAACNVAVGDLVDTTHYGLRRVLKINKVSVSVEGAFGPIKVGKEFVRKVSL